MQLHELNFLLIFLLILLIFLLILFVIFARFFGLWIQSVTTGAGIGIWDLLGIYMGYGIAYYAQFYTLKHVLILGRVTSGQGGSMMLNKANEVLKAEFPELAESITLHLPDEKTRRVGQAVAAASLPIIKK